MTKKVFLFVKSVNCSAKEFADIFNIQRFYENMVEEDFTEITVETEKYYYNVQLLEFGEVDERFIAFIQEKIVVGDISKSKYLFEVKYIKNKKTTAQRLKQHLDKNGKRFYEKIRRENKAFFGENDTSE